MWHHIVVTWRRSSGELHMYFDGEPKPAFWVAAGGTAELHDPTLPAATYMAAGTERAPSGEA